MSSNSPAPLFTNATAAAGPSSAAQFDPAAQEQTVTTLLLVLILGPLPPILLLACCALARHCLRKLRRKWAKRRARGGSRSRSPLGRRARRNSGSLTPLTNRSTTYADLELSSPRESDAGSAASVEAAYAASAAHAAEAALSAAPADDVEVEEALAYLQRRDVEAAGPSEAGLAPADEGSDEEGLGGTSL